VFVERIIKFLVSFPNVVDNFSANLIEVEMRVCILRDYVYIYTYTYSLQ